MLDRVSIESIEYLKDVGTLKARIYSKLWAPKVLVKLTKSNPKGLENINLTPNKKNSTMPYINAQKGVKHNSMIELNRFHTKQAVS